MTMEAEDILLIIPVYNPEPGWEAAFLTGYNRFCQAMAVDVPVVLSNDGSSVDLTSAFTYLKEKIGKNLNILDAPVNEGKGAALKKGAAFRDVNHYLFTDHDFPYTTESMVRVIRENIASGGITMGVRDEMYYQDMSIFRKFISKILKKLNAFLLNLPSNDTQCGLKAFDKKAKEILLQCRVNRFLIDLEFLLAAHHLGLRIIPVSVKLRQEIQFSHFNLSSLLKELGQFIGLVWKYRFSKP